MYMDSTTNTVCNHAVEDGRYDVMEAISDISEWISRLVDVTHCPEGDKTSAAHGLRRVAREMRGLADVLENVARRTDPTVGKPTTPQGK